MINLKLIIFLIIFALGEKCVIFPYLKLFKLNILRMRIKIFTLSLAAVLLLGVQLSAQKVKNERFTVAYTQLPSNPLDNEFTTYRVNLYGSGYIHGHSIFESGKITRQSAMNKINLGGFKKVTGNAHVRVQISVGNARTVKNEVGKKVTEKKSKDGKVTKTTSYFMQYHYYMPVSYRVYDYHGNLIHEAQITNLENVEQIKGSSFNTYSKAYEDWKKRRLNTLNNSAASYVRNAMNSVNASVNYRYGYPHRSEREEIKIVKKHSSEDDFVKAYETTNAAFAKVKADAPMETIAADLQPAIDFWMGYDKYPADDRKLKRVRYACLFNLTTVYYWMDDMENANKYATECLKIDYKEGGVKRYVDKIRRMKQSFQENGVDSRHFFIDVEAAAAPSNNVEVAAPEEEEANNASMTGNLVLADGTAIEGDVVVNTEDGSDLVFGPKGNVVFNYKADGKDVSNSLNPAEIQSFSFNGRSFKVMDFTPGAKGNKTSGKHILEVIYDSPRIQLFKYYPYDDQLGDKKVEFALLKKNEPAPTSTSSTPFLLFKKGLAKYFEDCADLSELAAAGEIAHTEEGLVQAARIYAEVCEERP
ncbi:MAG: hypothetical protein DWQ02_23040 [Bacteroidetes bacterium]|nr:MAG: hypothetical protein DWQ02_23040 [Bacteroidota bacterium]